MTRLIDVDSLKEKLGLSTGEAHCVNCRYFKKFSGFCDGAPDFDYVCDQIDGATVVEAEPVRHGRWLEEFKNEDGRSLRCSRCLTVFWVGYGRDGNYCPNCGAKMDAERKEE